MDAMKYHDLRDFLTLLEQQGELKRITLPVDPHLEITEIADRTLRAVSDFRDFQMRIHR